MKEPKKNEEKFAIYQTVGGIYKVQIKKFFFLEIKCLFRYILSQQRAKTTQVPPIFRFLISFTTTGIESSFYHSIYVYFVFLFFCVHLLLYADKNLCSPGLKFKWFYYCASSYPPLLLVTSSCSFVIFFFVPQ